MTRPPVMTLRMMRARMGRRRPPSPPRSSWPPPARSPAARRGSPRRSPSPARERAARRQALLRALLGLPHARRRRRPGHHAATSASASASTARTSTCARRQADNVLYAIRNGGFSGAIMPENIVVGKDADDVAAVPRQVLGRRPSEPARRRRLSPCRARPQADPPRPRRGPRGAGAARRPSWPSASTSCSSSTRGWREATAAAERLRAEQKAASEAIAAAKRAGRGRRATRSRAMKDVSGAGQGAGRDARAAPRSELQARPRRRCPTCPTRPRPTRTRSCARSARRGASTGRRPPRAGRRAHRHGARRAAVGLALRLPARRPRPARARARALGAGQARRPRLRARHPARARARGGAVRHRLPARHRAADLPPARGRPLPRRHQRGRARLAARRRDPRRRCRCATRASRRASGARRAPRARTRAGSSACTSSTRSRCSRSSSPARRATSTSACWRIEEEILQRARDPLPRGQHRRRRPRRQRRQEVRLRGVAARPGALPRADLDVEHDRLPGAAPGDPPPPRGRRGPRSLHTLNGTAVDRGAHIIALLENGQREDGSVALPAVLAACGAPRASLPPQRTALSALVARGVDVERRVQARDLEQPQHGRVRARRAPCARAGASRGAAR